MTNSTAATKLAAPALRTAHDLGLAAWFGGELMGVVGVNSTARRAEDLSQRHQLAAHPWERWAPVSSAAIGLHLAATAGLLAIDRPARGARGLELAKVVLTGTALGLTVMADRRTERVERQVQDPGPDGPEDPSSGDLGHAQDELRVLRWSVTALTGAAVALNAVRHRP